jgi:hypothetical protein
VYLNLILKPNGRPLAFREKYQQSKRERIPESTPFGENNKTLICKKRAGRASLITATHKLPKISKPYFNSGITY